MNFLLVSYRVSRSRVIIFIWWIYMRYVYSRGAVVSPRLQRESPHFNQHLLMKFFIDVQKGDMKSWRQSKSFNKYQSRQSKKTIFALHWLACIKYSQLTLYARDIRTILNPSQNSVSTALAREIYKRRSTRWQPWLPCFYSAFPLVSPTL